MKFPPHKIVPLADLIPYANNARTHSPAQVSKDAILEHEGKTFNEMSKNRGQTAA